MGAYKNFFDIFRTGAGYRRGSTANAYDPAATPVTVGIGKCRRKGHRPPDKHGHCTRCGTFIRIEDLNVGR